MAGGPDTVTVTDLVGTDRKAPGSGALPARLILLPIGLVAVALVYAFGVHMDRMIVFDEVGLHHPVYLSLTTGHMAYPMHGQPDFMVVHPPTHYWIIAQFMKLGMPLFTAAAMPLVLLTGLLALVVATSAFPIPVGAALLLGFFAAMGTWAEFYTLRPDLHVTAAWFAGLVTLEAARLTSWSRWRLFVGSALMVLAASVHYWGIAALLGPLCYAAVLICHRGLHAARTEIACIVGGGCLIGVPFLVLFVLPMYDPMTRWVETVQGARTGIDAFSRHLRGYEAFALRVPDGWGPRSLVTALSAPLLDWRIPAILVAVPILTLVRQTRLLGIAGAILPLFVLFGSQSKQIGYTGYFTPEFVLYFSAVFVVLFQLLFRWRPARVPTLAWTLAGLAAVSIAVFTAVPTSMGREWAWTSRLDTLDVQRAASKRIVGDQAAVAVTSGGVWYTSGATYLWNGLNEIVAANRLGRDVADYLRPLDAVVIDTSWWNATPALAPVPTWYAQGKLSLRGFVLPTSENTRQMMQLLVASDAPGPVRGYFVDPDRIREFSETPEEAADTIFAVLRCPVAAGVLGSAWYQFAFTYDRRPSPEAPVLLLVASSTQSMPLALAQAGRDCSVVDRRAGTLRTLPRRDFAAALQDEPPIRLFSTRDGVLRAAGRIR